MKKEYTPGEPRLRVEGISVVMVRRDKDYMHSYKNGRSFHGFIYIFSGNMRDDFTEGEKQSIDLGVGDLIFIPKGTSYIGNYLEDGTEIRIVQFDITSGELPECLRAPVKLALPNARELMEAFFNHTDPAPDRTLYYLSCLYRLIFEAESFLTRPQPKYRRLGSALAELSENYDKEHPVSYYSALADMSEVNFRRLFREYTGKSPIEYRNDLRLEVAKARIQSGEYNVSEAAESVGFTNRSFFIRLYKRKYGHTPKQD